MIARRALEAARRRWRAVVFALAAALAVLVGWSGAGVDLDHGVQNLRFAIRGHAASGDLHLVEIDARSMAALDHWPLPRRNYALVIDHLRRAGAASIAFDVDLSSRSNPADDHALAAALDRAGGAVALPTLRQEAGGGHSGYVDTLPIPELRAHAMAAAVSIRPDADGYIRTAPIGRITAGVPRPSLAAMIAGRAGSAGRDFPIDYSIDPDTIPRHSFLDIRDGKFDPAAIAGKHILIGATAVETSDRYPTPRFGVIYGVVIQALAAETLFAGLPVRAGWLVPLLIALALSPTILRGKRQASLFGAILFAPVALFALSLAAEWLAGYEFQLVPALTVLLTITAATLAVHTAAALRHRRLTDEQTGMPNRLALIEDLTGDARLTIAAAHIADYDKLLAALGAGGAAEMVCRVRDRITMLGGGQLVYRIGDRVLAWRSTVELDEVHLRYEQLRRMMLIPVEVKGRRADVSLAAGVAEGDARDPASVLANAALAAAQALDSGAGWHVHSDSEGDTIGREVSLLGELDQAVANGEIEVAYQPKLHIASGRVTSVEALVRWNHPTRGRLGPDTFIPLAERSDRIAGLTLHVLERTIADLHGWAAMGHPINGAVNISAKLLDSAAFLNDVAALIGRSGLDPKRLTLEVTESAAMSDRTGAAAALTAIKALGVAISMDDYGTGQSTLSYLKQLPLDELKLDRSFVQFAHQNRSDAVLVRSTVELAHELGLKVVAEGVEDEACLAYLRSVGCDMAQGYLISKPTTAEAIAELVRQPRQAAA